ncbi:amidase family protein [Flavobacteriaceae bacterium]|nr:amidase family protein [Flavobacteriaceae bacterium]
MRSTNFLILSIVFFLMACHGEEKQLDPWVSYDETEELQANQDHPVKRMRFKRIQSQHSDRNTFFTPFKEALLQFTEEEYNRLKPLILEQDILSIQTQVQQGNLTYEKLTLFYLYRIYLFENKRDTYLNAIIALNPEVLDQARAHDKNRAQKLSHPLYGMPILLKDNINAIPMATTAGAAAFKDNFPSDDAFLVKRLKAKGALILGKVNLSEWAYYFCQGCPLGYSAMGGQTLNPYGRKVFETGGSSSGSGVAVAANYAVAAIGSETSGSILSPSGKNSVVGLKPTIGAVSRSGVVPISSTLDTAGPMTKNVLDNAILMDALVGEDQEDVYGYASKPIAYQGLDTIRLKGKHLGVIRDFEEDSLLQNAIQRIKAAGAKVTFFDPPEVELKLFRRLLDVDMRADLPKYIQNHAASNLPFDSVQDVISFNQKDTLLHAPYGQEIFQRIARETLSQEEFSDEKQNLMRLAKSYFQAIDKFDLDAVVSIDNNTASFAAAAHYPALGVPMGYQSNGQPKNITFIAPSRKEQQLLELGAAFEHEMQARKIPKLFQ